MIDIVRELEAIHREVGARPGTGGDDIAVQLRRTYDAAVEDVWDAVTDPDRVKRWFLPLHGDLRVGGTFQLEGNAGGEILRCERPRLLTVTFGGAESVVELRLSPVGEDGTALELEHTVPVAMAGSGAGSLYVGPGWDGALLGLGLFLRGEVSADPVAAASSPQAQGFSRGSVAAWATAVEASGTATAAEIAAATDVATAQFAPDTVAVGSETMSLAALTGIHHLKFPVSDLNRSRAWYGEVFGLQVEYEFPDEDGVVRGVAGTVPGLGGTGLALRENRAAARGLGGFDPVSFAIADRAAAQAWVERLDALGVAHSPVVEASFGWIVSFHDPDGTEIRLYSVERRGSV